jgi:aminopeptidase-like protein
VAFLSHHEPLIASMFGGLFLEMLGLQQPHAVQSTFEGDGYIDRCVQLAVHGRDPEAWTGRLREVVGNDERQFNAPGVRVPMASLSRVLKPGGPWTYYREYHTSLDTPERVSDAALEESCAVVLDLVDILETDRVVDARCRGEIFCSRYGLEIDWAGDRDGTARLFEALDRIDGGHTISEIARSTQLPYPRVRQLMADLERHGLVALREPVVARQRS